MSRSSAIVVLLALCSAAQTPAVLPATGTQTAPAPSPNSSPQTRVPSSGDRVQTPAAPTGVTAPQPATAPTPLRLTLADALRMARANSPRLQTAVVNREVAREDHKQARAALLPGINYTDQYLYTQGNYTPSGRFIANNAVHEYLSQGTLHQPVFDFARVADYHRTAAVAAVASAQSEAASRDLNAVVIQTYYALVVAQRKLATAQQSAVEAHRFLTISQQLEQGGEVAHADVVRAELQSSQRDRELADAQVLLTKARGDLAVLILPQYREDVTVEDDLDSLPPLPDLAQLEGRARAQNPDLAAATAGLQQAKSEVSVARAGYLPSISLDYFYGIDATHFATRDGRTPNLGYAGTATFALPVWNWGTTHSKVRQAELRRHLAEVELSTAERTFSAGLRYLYAEADVARNEIAGLQRSNNLAAENLRLVNMRYRAGESTVLEVVDAQNSMIAARNALDDGEARYRTALANLQTVTGIF